MNKPRILFAGGGSEQDSRPLDEIFARWVGSKGRLLYLPVALVDEPSMQYGIRWVKSVFEPLGLTRIDAWKDLSGKTAQDLQSYDGVYIGGGNTFHLLNQVRVHHLDRALVDFILAGHPAYGGSAGAILLSHDISACVHIDPDIVGLRDLSALDLALGYTIWCHYQPADDPRIQDYNTRQGRSSIAISERAGVYREGDDLFAAGYEPAHVFDGVGKRTVAPGEKIVSAG